MRAKAEASSRRGGGAASTIGMPWRGTHAAELSPSHSATCRDFWAASTTHDAPCTIGSYLPRPGKCDSIQPGGRSMRFWAALAVW